MLKKTLIADVHVLDSRIAASGDQELMDVSQRVGLSFDLSEWATEYKGTLKESAFAEAIFKTQQVSLNADRYASLKERYYRVERIVHEYRHLMIANDNLSSNAPSE